MGLKKYGEGEVILDEEQQKTAAKKEWSEEDQEELEAELRGDGDTE